MHSLSRLSIHGGKHMCCPMHRSCMRVVVDAAYEYLRGPLGAQRCRMPKCPVKGGIGNAVGQPPDCMLLSQAFVALCYTAGPTWQRQVPRRSSCSASGAMTMSRYLSPANRQSGVTCPATVVSNFPVTLIAGQRHLLGGLHSSQVKECSVCTPYSWAIPKKEVQESTVPHL